MSLLEDPRDFDSQYTRDTPPWEIAAPQPCVVDAYEAGLLTGGLLDIGCGTGQNAVWLAGSGVDVTGMDISRIAIDRARKLALEKGVAADFVIGSALNFSPSTRYQTLMDSAVFHIFPDDEQERYLEGAKRILAPGGSFVGFCFSEKEPDGWGPRRLSEEQLRARFENGWSLESLERVFFKLNRNEPVHAWRWLARAKSS